MVQQNAQLSGNDDQAERRKKLKEIFDKAVEAHRNKRLEDAEAGYRQVLAAAPSYAPLWHNMGALLRQRGQLEASMLFTRRSLELSGLRANIVGNLENALIDSARVHELHGLEMQFPPQDSDQAVDVLIRDARLRRAAGFSREASALFDRASEKMAEPANPLDYAMALLEHGQFERGFELYEHRWNSGQISLPRLEAPKWDLQADVQDKHVVLFGEQGLGDFIFLSRFLPALRALGMAKLSAVVRPPLVRLMQENPHIDEVFNRDEGPKPTEIDTWLTAFDMARMFLKENEPTPPPAPMPLPQDAVHRGLRVVQGFENRMKVGICWATSPTGGKATQKSVSIDRFLQLSKVPGLQLFSLYKGKNDDQLITDGYAGIVIDSGRNERDLADSAGLIQQLDLVISVDTAVAHLAATLGKPTWILVPEPAFWYWRDISENCRFYPSARLIRQVYPGDWDVPFDRIKMDLERMLR